MKENATLYSRERYELIKLYPRPFFIEVPVPSPESVCICVLRGECVYMCVEGNIDLPLCLWLSTGFWNCSDCDILELFCQCGILELF